MFLWSWIVKLGMEKSETTSSSFGRGGIPCPCFSLVIPNSWAKLLPPSCLVPTFNLFALVNFSPIFWAISSTPDPVVFLTPSFKPCVKDCAAALRSVLPALTSRAFLTTAGLFKR